MTRVDYTRKLLYSDFFAQLQSAQDLLSERLGTCLVLINAQGKELTLPSRLPLICHNHESPTFHCLDCHAHLIARLAPALDFVTERCPYGLYVTALETSIRADDGPLYLLAGRTADRPPDESDVGLLKSIYTLPFETPGSGRKPEAHPKDQAVLTVQENKVLACIVTGLSNKDIAYRLCISQSTVKAHVANILKKLNLSNRTEASVYALKNGMNLGDERA